MNNNYKRTLSDIDVILNQIDENKLNKIPIKLRNLIKNNKLEGYISKIDINRPLEEQELHEDTVAFLTMLYVNYWCEQEEKEEITSKLKENEIKYQEELRDKYNPDNIFKNSKKESIQINTETKEEQQIVVYKESFIQRIISKIFSFLRRNHYERN